MVDEPTEYQDHASQGIEDFDLLLNEATGESIKVDRVTPVRRIEYGWLVEEVEGCTCNGPSMSVSSHEPGCGLEPLQRLDDLPGWVSEAKVLQAAATALRAMDVGPEFKQGMALAAQMIEDQAKRSTR